MADDRMKDDDLKRNMGAGEGQKYGQQTPGRNPQGEGEGKDQGGQHVGGQDIGGKNVGQQQKGRNLEEDDEFGAGTAGRAGGQTRGSQNR